MKILFFLIAIIFSTNAQSIEEQTELLTRTTAKNAVLIDNYKDYQKIIQETRLDYVRVTNIDEVNIFYFSEGELRIIKPQTSDIFITKRDNLGKVIEYPAFFLDKSSQDKKIFFTVGVCKYCRNSTIGVQYGFYKKE